MAALFISCINAYLSDVNFHFVTEDVRALTNDSAGPGDDGWGRGNGEAGPGWKHFITFDRIRTKLSVHDGKQLPREAKMRLVSLHSKIRGFLVLFLLNVFVGTSLQAFGTRSPNA